MLKNISKNFEARRKITTFAIQFPIKVKGYWLKVKGYLPF